MKIIIKNFKINFFQINLKSKKSKKVISTRTSRAVPHHSTNLAFSRLTSEFGRDPVCSTEYGLSHWLLQTAAAAGSRTAFPPALHARPAANKQTNKERKKERKKESDWHLAFPSVLTPKYYPGLRSLNFGVRKGSGVFD